jgi:hypothetical protein
MSDSHLRMYRYQDTYPAASRDQASVVPRVNNRAEQIMVDFYAQAAMDGKMFNASNAVQETLEDISETARGSNNINPALLLDIPAGTTGIPVEILVEQGLDGTDQDIQFTINTDDAARYSSGGVAITPVNMRKDDGTNSTVLGSFYSGSTTIVATSNTDDDMLYASWWPAEALPRTAGGLPSLHWSARTHIPPILVGPASLLIFVVSATADQTYNYSVKWIEMPTTAMV